MSDNTTSNEKWTLEIKPRTGWFNLQLAEVWRYRDLILLFVRRDFVSVYKQTILGPLWFFIQPLLTSILFVYIFSKAAGLGNDGLPAILFYLSGLVCWAYFADALIKTSDTFFANANIFGKVYFPRLVIPISLVISSLLKFTVQFLLFIGFVVFFLADGQIAGPNINILWFPVLLLLMAGMGLGFGIIISSLTTKYRDLRFMIQFGVQLLMYMTVVVIPLAQYSSYAWLVKLHPMTVIIEYFRKGFLGAGLNPETGEWVEVGVMVQPIDLLVPCAYVVVALGIGLLLFTRVEKNFMDTV